MKPIAASFGLPSIDTATREVSLAVSFSEPVTVKGRPSIPFMLAGERQQLGYVSGSGKKVLTFRSNPGKGVMPTAANVAVPKQAIQRNGGALIDTAGNRLAASAFEALDMTAPRVAGANSTGLRGVLVNFSEAMDSNILNPELFAITHTNINAEAGVLPVHTVRFADGSCTAVRLKTGLQNELNYTVRVIGGSDVAGNVIAGPTRIGVDPAKTTFTGTPPMAGQLGDSDKDGLSDNVELRGWLVSRTLLNGKISEHWVTSDPTFADSDSDGLLDNEEQKLGLDPRNADTDGDQLNDYSEYNEIYCDPTIIDSDGDGLDDSLEFNFYHSSPTDKDTDGDQIPDNIEIILGNRNLRLADAPKPGIEIGSVQLKLDIRHTFTNQEGVSTSESESAESTLTQSETESSSDMDARSHEFTIKASYETGWSTKAGVEGIGASGKFMVEGGTNNSWSSSFTEESARETQEAIAKTFTTERAATQEETVEREIAGATMKVSLNLKSLSNIAFAIKNLQITAFAQDPSQFGKLIPVATLLPDREPEAGFTLGPEIPERGPFIFSNDTIFASLVEELMINPRGLIFKISNYDIIDERGRNFAFSSQDINDRTSPLVIDFGYGDVSTIGASGTTERYRISTSAGRKLVDTNQDHVVDEKDRTVSFDPATGRAVGITITDAMQTVLGLTKYDEDTNPSSSLTQLELEDSYSTKILSIDTDRNPATPPTAVETLWRIRDVSCELTSPLKKWVVYTTTGIDAASNFSDLILKPESGLTFKFLQDLDDDGLDAAQEFILGSSDSDTQITVPHPVEGDRQQMKGFDTDLDGLSDAFEFFGGPTPTNLNTGWRVEVVGKTAYRGFSSPARGDSDLDGVSDYDEYHRFVEKESNGLVVKLRQSTDPQNPDTDGDGISDYAEMNGYTIRLRFPTSIPNVIRTSDPLNPDTDGDTLRDGDEQTLGTDPMQDDAAKVLDSDGDGLVNFQEDKNDQNSGWNVTVYNVSTTGLQQGSVRTYKAFSESNKKDSDSDGLSDKEEFDLKTDPNKSDTDGDGLNDIDEVNIIDNGPRQARTITLKYNPLDADMDNDRRSDGSEVKEKLTISIDGESPYYVFSDPMQADVDSDQLVDGDEMDKGTDPTAFDTDKDNKGIGDKTESDIGTNPRLPDQKIKITINSIRVSGDVDDNDVGTEDLELFGSIKIGIDGQTFTTVQDYSNVDVTNGWTSNINKAYSYILKAGDAKITLIADNFYDYDSASGNDTFSNSSVDFKWKAEAGNGEITLNGDKDTGTNVKLHLAYSVSIVQSKE